LSAYPVTTVTIFNDQRRRLIGVVVSNANHEKRPAAERDGVAGPPVRHRRP